MRSAWDLNKSLPSSKFYVIDSAGHSMKEIGISKKLIEDLLITNNQVLKLTTAFSLILDKH